MIKSAIFQRLYEAVINPAPDESIVSQNALPLPTLWLLGKTGSGKSTFIQTLTGDSDVVVGNGYQPCTKTSTLYSHPKQQPIVGFLDSRGLDEVDYDPAEDIAYCQAQSHAVVVVIALDDPDQDTVLQAFKQAMKAFPQQNALLVFSRKHGLNLPDSQRAMAQLQHQFEAAVNGKSLQAIQYNAHAEEDIEALREAVAALLPELHLWLYQHHAKDAESLHFQRVRREIIWYASAAAATDTLPGVGLVSVPTVQGKLLHTLGRKYDFEWDRKRLSAFSSALGASMLLRYGGQLGGRQLAKLIPGIGQTVGSATAAVISFSTTYALGRVACYFLYQSKLDLPVDAESLQMIYRQALTEAKSVRKEKNNGD